MESNSDPIWILFIADVESRDKLQKFSRGSQWEVHPVTAAALILVGAAVRLPCPATAVSEPGVIDIPTASIAAS